MRVRLEEQPARFGERGCAHLVDFAVDLGEPDFDRARVGRCVWRTVHAISSTVDLVFGRAVARGIGAFLRCPLLFEAQTALAVDLVCGFDGLERHLDDRLGRRHAAEPALLDGLLPDVLNRLPQFVEEELTKTLRPSLSVLPHTAPLRRLVPDAKITLAKAEVILFLLQY